MYFPSKFGICHVYVSVPDGSWFFEIVDSHYLGGQSSYESSTSIMSNEKRGPCFFAVYMSGMKSDPVRWGLFHKLLFLEYLWHPFINQTTSIYNRKSGGGFIRGSAIAPELKVIKVHRLESLKSSI